MNNLFRKSALERLSSPEQLDKTIQITSPLSWMAIVGAIAIIVMFIVWTVAGRLPVVINTNGIIVNSKDVITIHSPYAGQIVENNLVIGEHVDMGEHIGTIRENGGADTEIFATQKGIVSNITFNEGSEINKYDIIAKLQPEEAGNVLISYLPIDIGKTVQVGMKAIVSPISLDTQKYGHMEAEIISVDDYVTSENDIKNMVGSNTGVAGLLVSDYPMVSVVLKLKEDSNTASGYYWSSEKGRELDVTDGTIADIKIIISESAPISKLLPVAYVEEG